jgi:DNA-binding transcriptional MerR regulator
VSDTASDDPPAGAAAARLTKSASAFRTIGEVAEDLDLPAHVLRFWESKFPQLRPLKRGGGRRYYRPEDIVLLRRIRQCLYHDGYTIRGVQKLLAEVPAGGAVMAGSLAATPSLFPPDLEVGPVAAPEVAPAAIALAADGSATASSGSSDADALDRRAQLEELRRELLGARALLDQLLRRHES